ncbi:MAG: peptidase T [Bacteroidales bacterium]|jgi:tripeptide aminopeptidase|nr:peptidase T [Bacteroidales bacterium]MDD3330497.1 peptidase T [Bacteroidales bacterium]MDD3691607.1 peptidase T [Bacteroidales bacterium]MDD4045028.1 peptidase T [Bacteroidales bacterium]MDD4582077.1 peptidase T [Bacteroidales bacterium]
MRNQILKRFLSYIAVDSQSNPDSISFPSTDNQKVFAMQLVDELKSIGVSNAYMDEWGYVMASIPANTDKQIPAIGFFAHMDTAPDADGVCVHPQIIENYQGNDIILNAKQELMIQTADFPELLKYIGKTIICTDGTTLLGADDKAGIAEIMTAMEYILTHPEIEHGKICIGFTPDEEIGKGVDHFDVKNFGAEYAYTMDGGQVGELEYENFNAAQAKITVHGRNIHPGYAKDKMINAQLIAMELHAMLPMGQKPELTEHYEGFFLLIKFNGSIEEASMQYIIRDHDRKKFEDKKKLVTHIIDFLNKKYGENTVVCDIEDQYYNMREKIEDVMFVVDIAKDAMIEAGVKPLIMPIRGGTDGARLSFMGLPCPNIFSGGHNFHGKHEYVVLESMEKASEVILNIVKAYAMRVPR